MYLSGKMGRREVTFTIKNQVKMIEAIRIDLSDYAEEFRGFDINDVFLLSQKEATQIWSDFIDKNAISFFDLPDTNWLISSKRIMVGEWMKDFNANESEYLSQKLDDVVNWDNSHIVFFCMKRENVIMTKWSQFKKLWIAFLYCEDDCPILISSVNTEYAFVFRPVGDVVLIDNRK